MKQLTFKNEPLKKWSWQILACMALLVSPLQSISSHGTVTSPPSRVWNCFQENPESPDSPACAAAVLGYGTQALYDWSEVARMDANGMHRSIIMDGNLASAGRPDKYGGLDQVRDDWVATPVTPGPFTITWTISAPHETMYYDVYITKADWTPNQPLTWDSLELLVRTGGRPLSLEDKIDVVLPQRTGKHVIYSIWQRSKTPEAFYSTSDIDFGTSTAAPTPPVASFTSDNGQCGGSDVTFNAAGSSDPNGDALTYSWDFGDGTTAEGVEVSHSYVGLDNATVTLTVSDGQFSTGEVKSISLLVNETCQVNGGIITGGPFAFTAGDGIADNVSGVTLSGNIGETSRWIVTDDQRNILGLPGTPEAVDFDDAGVGTCFIYHLSHNGEISGLNPNANLSGLAGDFDLSNRIEVVRNAPIPDSDVDGGIITGGPFTFVVDDGIADNVTDVTLSGNVGETSRWIVTDDQRNILGLPDTPEAVNFDDAGLGTCFIYHLSHNGEISGLSPNANLSGLVGDFDLSNRIEVVRNAVNPGGDSCDFRAPLSSPLPTIANSYNNVYVTGNGGPDLSIVNNFTVNWNLPNNGLYQFSFNMRVVPWFINFTNATQNFDEPNPRITLSGTGIANLDGDYYPTTDGENFVLVADGYTIYFSNSATAPSCFTGQENIGAKNINELEFATLFPNPAVTSVTIQNETDLNNSSIAISDLSGRVIKSLSVTESTTSVTIDISGVSSGLYLVRISDLSGSTSVLKLIVN